MEAANSVSEIVIHSKNDAANNLTTPKKIKLYSSMDGVTWDEFAKIEEAINKHGGTVYINKIKGDSSLADANTYINSAGGSLWAGVDGEWIKAYNEQGSAEVHLLGGSSVVGDARIFTVGDEEVEDEE